MALESAKFRGELLRLNDERPMALPQTVQFKSEWNAGNLADGIAGIQDCELILGNHIIDDLLFALHYPHREQRATIYADPVACRRAWQGLEIRFATYMKALVILFERVVQAMPIDCQLILRHYPSTFALVHRDVARINLEMAAFDKLTSHFERSKICEVSVVNDDTVNVPPGSRFPDSIVTLRKLGC